MLVTTSLEKEGDENKETACRRCGWSADRQRPRCRKSVKMMTHVERLAFARCCFAPPFLFFLSLFTRLCRVAVSAVRLYHTTCFKSAHSRVTFKCKCFICGGKNKTTIYVLYVYKFDFFVLLKLCCWVQS